VLTNGSMIKDWYFRPPINKIIKVYVFNYTNVDKFMTGHDKKLHVNEIGPLVYEEVIEKVNVRYEGFNITFNVSMTTTDDR
jgi:scavenger receptor class B protein 1